MAITIPNGNKVYQNGKKLNGHEIHGNFLSPKYTKIVIFDGKVYHLATVDEHVRFIS
jgi:UTP:GlnB (protein PII) uridylyltransferase